MLRTWVKLSPEVAYEITAMYELGGGQNEYIAVPYRTGALPRAGVTISRKMRAERPMRCGKGMLKRIVKIFPSFTMFVQEPKGVYNDPSKQTWRMLLKKFRNMS